MLKFIFIVVCATWINVADATLADDIDGLQAIYDNLDNLGSLPSAGDNKWDFVTTPVNPCSPNLWVGIGCNSNNDAVVSLDFSSKQMAGEISADGFTGNRLSSLSNIVLDCDGNAPSTFTGSFSKEIIREKPALTQLSMKECDMNGEWPTEMTFATGSDYELAQLTTFDISYNKFTGVLDFELANANLDISVTENCLTNVKKVETQTIDTPPEDFAQTCVIDSIQDLLANFPGGAAAAIAVGAIMLIILGNVINKFLCHENEDNSEGQVAEDVVADGPKTDMFMAQRSTPKISHGVGHENKY